MRDLGPQHSAAGPARPALRHAHQAARRPSDVPGRPRKGLRAGKYQTVSVEPLTVSERLVKERQPLQGCNLPTQSLVDRTSQDGTRAVADPPEPACVAPEGGFSQPHVPAELGPWAERPEAAHLLNVLSLTEPNSLFSNTGHPGSLLGSRRPAALPPRPLAPPPAVGTRLSGRTP